MKKCVLSTPYKDIQNFILSNNSDWETIITNSNLEIPILIKKNKIHFIILDIESGGEFPTTILKKIRLINPNIKIFILTHHKINDLKSPLYEFNITYFFEMPRDLQRFIPKIKYCLNNSITQDKTIKYQSTTIHENNLHYTENFSELIGNSNEIYNIKKFIQNVSNQSAPILLCGETGTGKTMVAKIIHNHSKFKEGKFQSLNVSCIPENLAESILFGTEKGSFTDAETKLGIFLDSNGGTIFLDEIENLSLAVQAKLLNVLEAKQFRPVGSTILKKINFRLICATNQNLKKLVKENKFRKDLYYRIDVLRHTFIPLSKRKEDIPLLINHYLKSKNKTISSNAIKKLINFKWPGNIRQLFNCLERAYCNASNSKIIEAYHIEL